MVSSRIVAMFALSALVAACVPTAARTNARLEHGVSLGLVGGGQMLLEGEDGAGNATEEGGMLHAELDLQVARVREDGTGFAVQAKVPINIFYSTLDFYYQLAPRESHSYMGFGAELSIAPGFYGVYTRYLDDDWFLTFTQRFLVSSSSAVLINPQLTLGFEGSAELAAFAAFAYDTGKGVDIELDLFSDEDEKDYRKKFALLGLSARF